jgi:CheY-like chemotaxis protein
MPTILVIEDDSAIKEAISDILELAGFQVLSADDGLAGVSLAREQRPDLIICDIVMPFLDGYGVLAKLRQYPQTATIPFVFLTARTTQADMRQGMRLGADDYLTKPFSGENSLQQSICGLNDRLGWRINSSSEWKHCIAVLSAFYRMNCAHP